MKRALEALLVAAALVLAGFVTLRLASRRAPQDARQSVESQRPGRDVENSSAPPSSGPVASAVKGIPMIKLTSPPRRRSHAVEVPPADAPR